MLGFLLIQMRAIKMLVNQQGAQCGGRAPALFLIDVEQRDAAALVHDPLGDGIDRELVDRFMGSPEVRRCFGTEPFWSLGVDSEGIVEGVVAALVRVHGGLPWYLKRLRERDRHKGD